jgi:hypothetical protein
MVRIECSIGNRGSAVTVKDQFIRQGSRLYADIAAATRPLSITNCWPSRATREEDANDNFPTVGIFCIWQRVPPRSPPRSRPAVAE